MTVSTSGARHLLFRLAEPARLPSAMLTVLRDEVVLAGWLSASGMVQDARIRTGTAPPRLLAGPAQIMMLDGSIGLSAGDVSCGLRVVLAHETDAGVETVAGELMEAQVLALEVHVTAFDEVVATRELDASGVWLQNATSSNVATTSAVAPPAPAARTSAASPQPSFSQVVRDEPAPPPPAPVAAAAAPPAVRPSPTFSSATAMPSPIRALAKAGAEEDDAIPEPGDVVEHFAFGRCEVVKTDGDRLHLRLPKDQRLKEIALEMLKVTALEPVDGRRHFKLSRKL